MSASEANPCCPRFDPEPWDGKELLWRDKRFVKDHVISFLHMPLNFGAVMRRFEPSRFGIVQKIFAH